jgi:hypothetical protein
VAAPKAKTLSCGNYYKTHIYIVMTQNLTKRLGIWAAIVACLLMVPLVAMRFTSEVNWTGSDFVFAAVVLFGTALAYEIVSRKSGHRAYRIAVAIGVVTALLLVWMNGAVGIIGSENNPANLMYFGVLLLGVVGAIVSRLKPSGLTRTLFVMAIAQMLVPVLALIRHPDALKEVPGVIGVFMLNAIFAAMWCGSALMFKKADTAVAN